VLSLTLALNVFIEKILPLAYNAVSVNTEVVSFCELPGGTEASAIDEDDVDSGSTVKVLQTDTSVVFTIDIATAAGNSQNDTTSVFTEAALYANGRIFSMKTFKAKVKDSTVLLRIVWTITF
jgi:hypothetical protein